MDPGSVPKFQDFIKAEEGTAPENREYINPETGEKRFFTFIGGKVYRRYSRWIYSY